MAFLYLETARSTLPSLLPFPLDSLSPKANLLSSLNGSNSALMTVPSSLPQPSTPLEQPPSFYLPLSTSPVAVPSANYGRNSSDYAQTPTGASSPVLDTTSTALYEKPPSRVSSAKVSLQPYSNYSGQNIYSFHNTPSSNGSASPYSAAMISNQVNPYAVSPETAINRAAALALLTEMLTMSANFCNFNKNFPESSSKAF